MGSRTDVVELGLAQMSPELRYLIAYEPNVSLDLKNAQPLIDEILAVGDVTFQPDDWLILNMLDILIYGVAALLAWLAVRRSGLLDNLRRQDCGD